MRRSPSSSPMRAPRRRPRSPSRSPSSRSSRARFAQHAHRRTPPVGLPCPPMLTLETIRHAPKALLHDHLDGGLRPRTIVDLASEYGYKGLPTTDVDDLATWIRRGADRKS